MEVVKEVFVPQVVEVEVVKEKEVVKEVPVIEEKQVFRIIEVPIETIIEKKVEVIK